MLLVVHQAVKQQLKGVESNMLSLRAGLLILLMFDTDEVEDQEKPGWQASSSAMMAKEGDGFKVKQAS